MQKKYMRCFYQNRSLSLKYCQITQVSHWEHMHVKNKYKKMPKMLSLSIGLVEWTQATWCTLVSCGTIPTFSSTDYYGLLSSYHTFCFLNQGSVLSTFILFILYNVGVKYGLALDPLFPFFQVFCTCNFLFVLLQLLYSPLSGLLEGLDNFR